VEQLLADPTKARAKRGWTTRTSFEDLVTEMVEADLRTVNNESERRNRHD
jgi:GDPmannose 4,6-dehydratase